LEAIYYTIVAAGLYFISDWLLNRIEIARGERFNNRSIIFFLIILALALVSFTVMRYFMMASEAPPQ
jgi:hypothetical protein